MRLRSFSLRQEREISGGNEEAFTSENKEVEEFPTTFSGIVRR